MVVPQKNRIVPSLESKVTYEDLDRIEWRKEMILSRAGKSSGANKYWFNMKSVDFENINGRENLNEEVLLCKNETFDIVEAKLKELENWKNNKVYSEVANEGQR